jgi:hypothetical protein
MARHDITKKISTAQQVSAAVDEQFWDASADITQAGAHKNCVKTLQKLRGCLV